MCSSSPDIQAPPPPPQESKQPETMQSKRTQRNKNGLGAGTLLTGPSGIANAQQNTGSTTLLGG